MKSGGDMNVLVVSHEGMASGLVKAIQMIIGPQEQLFWMELTEGGVLPFAAELEAILNSWQKSGQSGLLFTDLLGGTPMNQAMVVITKLDLTKKVKIIMMRHSNKIFYMRWSGFTATCLMKAYPKHTETGGIGKSALRKVTITL
jgi:PTS system fructose IIA component